MQGEKTEPIEEPEKKQTRGLNLNTSLLLLIVLRDFVY